MANGYVDGYSKEVVGVLVDLFGFHIYDLENKVEVDKDLKEVKPKKYKRRKR